MEPEEEPGTDDRPWAPWQAKPPRRADAVRKPARTPLNRDRIIDAALEVLVAEGYEAVSMRRVAQALDTGAASLYAHVANKQELDQLMVDRVAAGLVVPEPDPEHWREQIAQVMRDLVAMLRAYPGLARASIGSIPLGEGALETTDRILAILRAAGMPDQVAAYAVDLIPLYVTAVAFEESVQGAAEWSADDIEKFTSELGKWFGSLPADRFPHIVALAGALTAGGGTDERFEFGVQVIVAGLASFIP